MGADRTQIEPLERRRMLSAATGPVVHPLMGFSRAGASGAATTGAIYGSVAGVGASSNGAMAAVGAKSLASFTLHWGQLKKILAAAPMEFTPTAEKNAVVIPLPTPDGTLSRFKVVEAPIMEAPLAATLAGATRTFRGVGIDDPTASLRLDYSSHGLHAQVLSVNGSYYIDPYFQNDAAGAHASYYKRDITGRDTDAWECDVLTPPGGAEPLSARTEAALDAIMADAIAPEVQPLSLTISGQLRTYRAAVAADGEYTTAVGGGTVSGGLNAVITAMNRVTGIYETELGIRMTLVANNNLLIYTNKNTDPYNNTNPTQLLSQNISNCNSVIGSANYDIGHVFTTGGGGVAYLGVVGRTNKAGGETGLANPTGDAYWVDYVAHEMGHQFGANHTFNTSQDSNRNAAHAYEPGSGSTIMAYAGIEGAEDLQPHSDPYFHAASLDEINTYVTGTIPTVGVITNTGNSAPTVSAGPAYTIPTGTPFVLTATGSDPDGDVVTYDWQEYDLGPAVLLTSADNGTSPILRDWVPSTSPSRIVPRLSNLLSNTLPPGEKLPAVARPAFKWRVIARDNKPGGGALSISDVTLAVVNTGSAFSVTAPNTAVSWAGGSSQLVTWNVAGTTGSGINTANVKISLSTDGGNTYPYVLAAGTANDGSESITVPSLPSTTSTARLKVEAVGNIFFDISNANFTVTSSLPVTAAPGLPALAAIADTGSSSSDRITRFNNSSPSTRLTFNVPGTISGAAVQLFATGGVLLGSGTGNGGTLAIVTDGVTTLANATTLITAKQTAPGMSLSPASSGLQVLVDALAPVVTNPGNQTFEASNSAGSPISFAPATASDNVASGLSVVHAPAAGASFPIGTTSVSATATDAAGNATPTAFNVTVNDPAWLRRESAGAYNFTGAVGAQTLHITAGRVVLTGRAATSRPGLALSIENAATAALEAAQTFPVLNLSGTGTLDIAAHNVVINYTGGSPFGTSSGSGYSGLSGLIAAGRNGLTPRIISSAADDTLTGVGIAEASAVVDFVGATADWNGQTVDNTSVLLKYTYAGDANLDGIISGDDYSTIDFNLGVANASGYFNGDFNYDGIISGDDYSTIDFNIGAQGSPL